MTCFEIIIAILNTIAVIATPIIAVNDDGERVNITCRRSRNG